MRYTLILSLFIFSLYGADASKPKVLLTIPAINALAQYEKDIVATRKAYDLMAEKAANAALDKMEREKMELTKKGDLDGAMAVNDAIKALTNGATLTAIEDNMKKQSVASALVGNVHDEIVGKWSYNVGGIAEFFKDGTCKFDGKLNGNWTITSNKFNVKWSNGNVVTFNIPIKDNKLTGTNNAGGSITITKLPAESK